MVKPLIFAVGDGFQESWANVFPVEVGDPAALGAEEALQNHAALAGLLGLHPW